MSSTITATAIHDTWTVDVPLYGTDAGSLSITHVAVATGFTSLVYDSTASPVTLADVVDVLRTTTRSPTRTTTTSRPPKAAKIAVKDEHHA